MPQPPNPYDFLPPAPSFTVTSDDVAEGVTLPTAQLSAMFGAGGEDHSPQLSWSGAPADTASFVVTCFDPDAPTGSGFWHWVVYDIPPEVSSLPAGAGNPSGEGLPAGAKQLTNDAGLVGYLGAAPPPGHGPHRYMFVVHALSQANLPIETSSSPAVCGFNMLGCTLARGHLTPVFEQS